MKVGISILMALAFGLAGTALADRYDALVAQGYRWVIVNGPYASRTEQGLQRATANHSEARELEMVEQDRAYYLIPGAIVQMIQENPATGISQVQMEGIVPLLWTYTKFLSKRPVQNIDGEIETPENSGFDRPEVPQQSRMTGNGAVSFIRVSKIESKSKWPNKLHLGLLKRPLVRKA